MYPPLPPHNNIILLIGILELRVLSERQKVPVDLDMYIKKLANSRRRILLVNDILQNVQVMGANRHTISTTVWQKSQGRHIQLCD